MRKFNFSLKPRNVEIVFLTIIIIILIIVVIIITIMIVIIIHYYQYNCIFFHSEVYNTKPIAKGQYQLCISV